VTTATLARRHAIAGATVIAITLGSVGWKRLATDGAERPSAELCRQLVDRYLEYTFLEREGQPSLPALTAALEHARSREEHGLDAADCQRRLARPQVECGLAASGLDELERCLP